MISSISSAKKAEFQERVSQLAHEMGIVLPGHQLVVNVDLYQIGGSKPVVQMSFAADTFARYGLTYFTRPLTAEELTELRGTLWHESARLLADLVLSQNNAETPESQMAHVLKEAGYIGDRWAIDSCRKAVNQILNSNNKPFRLIRWESNPHSAKKHYRFFRRQID